MYRWWSINAFVSQHQHRFEWKGMGVMKPYLHSLKLHSQQSYVNKKPTKSIDLLLAHTHTFAPIIWTSFRFHFFRYHLSMWRFVSFSWRWCTSSISNVKTFSFFHSLPFVRLVSLSSPSLSVSSHLTTSHRISPITSFVSDRFVSSTELQSSMSHVERCCENEEQRRRRNLTSSSSSSDSLMTFSSDFDKEREEKEEKKNNLQLTRTLFTCRVSHRQEKKSKTSNLFYLSRTDFPSFLLVPIF